MLEYKDYPTENVKLVVIRKNFKFPNEDLDNKFNCILNKYKFLKLYLINELDIKDILPTIKTFIKDNPDHFPVFMYNNNLIENKVYNYLDENKDLYQTYTATLAECIIRTFIQLISFYNEGIKNAFRNYPSVKRALVQIYFMVYFYFLRKSLMINLNTENEKELISAVVIYIAYALLGITEKSEIEEFVKTIKSDILNIDSKYISKRIDRGILILKNNPTTSFPALFNEFVDIEPKPVETTFVKNFISMFGPELAKVFIPNITDKMADSEIALVYFITVWYNFLYTNTMLNQKSLAIVKRLAGYGIKELQLTFTDIIFKGHFHRC